MTHVLVLSIVLGEPACLNIAEWPRKWFALPAPAGVAISGGGLAWPAVPGNGFALPVPVSIGPGVEKNLLGQWSPEKALPF